MRGREIDYIYFVMNLLQIRHHDLLIKCWWLCRFINAPVDKRMRCQPRSHQYPSGNALSMRERGSITKKKTDGIACFQAITSVWKKTGKWSFYFKYGLNVFSIPIVVCSPWPGKTRSLSGRTSSFSRIDFIISSKFPPGRSVRPIEPLKSVSPVKIAFREEK